MMRLLFTAAILFLCQGSPAIAAENWPGWRGPRGDGSVVGQPDLPTRLDRGSNLLWKTELPGIGHASPVIWEDDLFTVTADEDAGTRSLLRIDRRTGKILWEKVVLSTPSEGIHRLNSRASSTPVTDGKSVFVSFLDETEMFVAAFDFAGNKRWEKRPGPFSSKHGYCSCPILWNGKVIINGDHDGEAYLVALDQNSGEIIWKTERPNKTRSYCTPIIRSIHDRNQMMLSGSLSVASYDPDTGKQQWLLDGPTEQFVASLVYNESEDLLFLTCGFPEKHLMAIRPGGSGNVTDSHVAWRDTAGASYVPSPISIDPYFLVVADNGVASCFEAKTGTRHWRERLVPRGAEGGHSASPLSANGLAYFFSDAGFMTVIRPGETFDVVAQSELGEEIYASPAVYGNQFYIRGNKSLFCFGPESK